jgi:hypothetical protein
VDAVESRFGTSPWTEQRGRRRTRRSTAPFTTRAGAAAKVKAKRKVLKQTVVYVRPPYALLRRAI